MAHPYAEHRQHKVERERVSRIAGKNAGGGVHADEAADKRLIRGMVKPAALKAAGGAGKSRLDRYARGGKVGKKGQTTVNVMIAPQSPPEPVMPVPPPAAPPMPPPRPPMPPMAGPPGMPPGMPPMRAKGGAVKSGRAWDEGRRNGTPVEHSPGKNDTSKISRTPPITKKRGGSVKGYPLTAGSDTGEGRLQKARAQARK